jgi:hypothetical protein
MPSEFVRPMKIISSNGQRLHQTSDSLTTSILFSNFDFCVMEVVDEGLAKVTNAGSEIQRLENLQKTQTLSSEETNKLKLLNDFVRSVATFNSDLQGSGGSSAHGKSSKNGLLRRACEFLNLKYLIKLCVCLY